MKPLALIVIAFTFFHCTIEKRIHQKGYHVEWISHTYSDPKATTETVSVAKEIDTTTPRKILLKEESTTLPLDNQPKQIPDVKKLEISKPIDFFENGNKCGVIELTSGKKIEFSTYKVMKHNLYYKKCSEENDDWQTINVEKIFKITDPQENDYYFSEKANENNKILKEATATSKKTEPRALIAIVLLLLIYPIIIASPYIGVIYSIIAILAAFILAINSFVKIKNNPNRYKMDKKGAALLIVITSVLLAFASAIAIGLFFYF
jgi:hypothetical protein